MYRQERNTIVWLYDKVKITDLAKAIIAMEDNFLTAFMSIFVNSKEHNDNESPVSIIDLLVNREWYNRQKDREVTKSITTNFYNDCKYYIIEENRIKN